MRMIAIGVMGSWNAGTFTSFSPCRTRVPTREAPLPRGPI